ncbi:hypothetical protein MBUL_04443 (plasmid) [Methylobacterium bullatum]|uniref:Helix-turn-helix domain-containing protein n=1 Tax=Methylobacterium bullatum TaxID=570505 RepID=A0A679JRL7_9HYPH|nr:hypothetical protein MBUL_04443 [Methylobacterium bullatum]
MPRDNKSKPLTESDLQGVTIPTRTAQAAIGLSDEAFYGAIRRKEIPALRIGGRYLILGAPFREMLGLQPQGGEAEE